MSKKKIKNNPFLLSDWTVDSLQSSWEIIKDLAINKYGLTFYNPHFEVVTFEDMLHIYVGSLPIIYDHWSHGKLYQKLYKQYINNQMGLAYEVIFNTNPALCYLNENNSPTMQGLTQAHAAIGHSAFFKNNFLFKEMTNADTIIPFLKNMKAFVSECDEKYGSENVSRLLDVCHALHNNAIDRKLTKEKTNKEKEEQKRKRLILKDKEYDVKLHTIKLNRLDREVSTNYRLREENILKFIGKFSPALKQWQRDIISMYCKMRQYLYPQMLTKISNEGFACVSEDTEYLSDNGWVKIKDYNKGKVAQYTEEGDIEFVQPLEFFKYKNAELLEIQSEGVNQCVTPNHRIIYNSSRGNLNEIEAKDLNLGISRYFINGGVLKSNSKLELTNEQLRVMVAIIADGHFNPNSNTNYCQIAFTKIRKIQRMENLLKAAKIEFKITKQTQNRTCFSFQAPERNKELNMYFKASKEQLQIILDEYIHWDGCIKNKRKVYFGINKNNIDFLQYAAVVTNNKTSLKTKQLSGNRKLFYTLEILSSKITTLSGGAINKLEGKHDVYCFQVPSGMFITRRKNVVNITGNSFIHYTLMTDLSEMGILPPGSTFEFLHSHCSVINQPGYDNPNYYGINPYKLGFEIYKDIRRICESPTEEDKVWFPHLIGKNWIDEVKFAAYNFKDESFIRQYLSPKVIRDLKLFLLEDDENDSKFKINNIHDDDGYKNIRKALSENLSFENRVPDMYVEGWDAKNSRTLYIIIEMHDNILITPELAAHTTELLKTLWPFKIHFKLKSGGDIIEEGIY